MGSIYPPYLQFCPIAPRPEALCDRLRHATEVFDDGESNECLNISQLLWEVVETASETPPCLLFFVDLMNFSLEFAFGPTFIRFLVSF